MPHGFNITKRTGSNNYYIRVYIPDALKAAAGGKAEVWESLRTPSHKEAKLKAPGVADRIITSLRPAHLASEAPAVVEPARERLQDAARAVYAALLEADEDERMHDAEAMQPGGRDRAAANRTHAQMVRESIGCGDLSHGEVEHWADVFGFRFKPGSVLEREFRQMLARAEAEASERAAERDLGQPLSTPADDLFRAPVGRTEPLSTHSGSRPTADAPAPSLEDLWATYEWQTRGKQKPATLSDKKKSLDLFIAHIGSGRAVDTITKAEARDYRDLLRQMPLHAGTKAKTKGIPPVKLVEMNKREGGKTVSMRTVAKQVSELSSVFDWLMREGHVDENIWQHLAPQDDRHSRKRAPFTLKQLQHLMNSPVFAGCLGEKNLRQLSTPGRHETSGPDYWLPLLGMFTGARLGELAQLETDDIRRADGIEYIKITAEGGDRSRSVKSKAAERSVPLHSRLIALGFLDYVADVRRSRPGRLFPALVRNVNGQFANASRDFSRYLDAIELPIEDGQKKPTFHCLRHSFIDELRAKHPESMIQPLVGHEAKTVTRGYGVRETFDLAERKRLVEAVQYPGLDFQSLKRHC